MTKRRDDPSSYSASYSCCSLLLQLLLPRVAIATTTPTATAFRGFCNISFNLIRVECRRRRLCSIVGRRFDLAAPVCERACCNRVACCSVCCLPSAGCRLRVAGCGLRPAGCRYSDSNSDNDDDDDGDDEMQSQRQRSDWGLLSVCAALPCLGAASRAAYAAAVCGVD